MDPRRRDLNADLVTAFPESWRGLAPEVVALMPQPMVPPSGSFEVVVDHEPVAIPYRIYNEELPSATVSGLRSAQRTVVHCLYSRHNDGFVRERHVRPLLVIDEPIVVPFVVRLVGEYVVEILEAIAYGLDLRSPHSAARELYGKFVTENPAFFDRTARQVVSYWSCYHRRSYPLLQTEQREGAVLYPGFDLVLQLHEASGQTIGNRLPIPRRAAALFDAPE